VRCRDRGSLRGLRREIHGRRRSSVFRLPAGPRGRHRASRARGAGVGGRREQSEDPHGPSDAGRHCDGTGSGRRSDRFGRFSGASHRRRDAEPCGALAGRCRSEQRRDCRKHPQAPG
jgi:hypothetical protein